jgi:hypothetical protein
MQRAGRRLSGELPHDHGRGGMARQEAELRIQFERQLQDARRPSRSEQPVQARRSPSDELRPGEDPLAHAR